MGQVEVNDDGIAVVQETPPVVSMYGKVMREGGTYSNVWPWSEITGITLAAIQLPPDGRLLIILEILLTSGRDVTVSDREAGFATAVAGIAARSGRPVPDLSTFDGAVPLWP